MEKQLTAVEWLNQKLALSSEEELVGNINLWFKQAQKMEKQQIIDAYRNGKINQLENSEIYYNETFKSE